MIETRLITTSFASLAHEFSEAISWLQSIEAIGSDSRFFEYQRRLERAIEIFESKDQEAARTEFEKMAVALYELSEVNSVAKSLRGHYDDVLRERFRSLATGPVDYRAENCDSSANRSRNIGFELVVASCLHDSGLPLDFESSTDVSTEFGSHRILIECKRPQTRNKLEQRYKDASRQLRRKLDGAIMSKCRGIVAIDATKIMNPEFLMLDARDDAEVSKKASLVVDMFLEQNERIWRLKPHKRKIGIIVRMAFLSAVQARDNLLTFAQEIDITQTPTASGSDFELLRSLAQRLRTAGQSAA